MGGSFVLDRKAVVRLLQDLARPPFEVLRVALDASGFHLSGIDESSTMVLDAVLLPKAARPFQPDSNPPISVQVGDIREFLNGVFGHFDDADSTLSLRIKKDSLELHFRKDPTIVRARTLRDLPDSRFTMPKFGGLSKAPRCSLVKPGLLSMAATTFGERSPELTLSIGPEQLSVKSTTSDFLTLPVSGGGSSSTRLHRFVFEATSPLCALEPLLTSIEVWVVDEGVAQFTFTFGDEARATYVAAPMAHED